LNTVYDRTNMHTRFQAMHMISVIF